MPGYMINKIVKACFKNRCFWAALLLGLKKKAGTRATSITEMMHMGNNMCNMNLVMKGKLKPQAVNPNMPMTSVKNKKGRRGKSRRGKSRRVQYTIADII